MSPNARKHTHKFVHTISGIQLTEVQKVRIREEIAATVARVLLGMAPPALSSNYQSEHPVCGGMHEPEDADERSSSDNPDAAPNHQDGAPAFCPITTDGVDRGGAA